MSFKEWYALRGPRFVARRASALLSRYGITSSKAEKRTRQCVTRLAENGCFPTFPTPGSVVQRSAQFVRSLQEAGAEIAVHSFDHVDLASCPTAEALAQLNKAIETFRGEGIRAHGFRCPYLRCTDALLDAVPSGLFEYSSNRAVYWRLASDTADCRATTTSGVLQQLYAPRPAAQTVCVPHTRHNFVEIPACLPDDLELHDGRGLDADGMARAWGELLYQTHARGEACVILFHPELAQQCMQPLLATVRQAKALTPAVWIARLSDISAWWREKSVFTAEVSSTDRSLRVAFRCSARATILVKGFDTLGGCAQPWVGGYQLWPSTQIQVPYGPRPFLGVSDDAPENTVAFLREQGYILERGDLAPRCGVFLDAATLAGLPSEVQLIEHIEAHPGPLVRYWRWPNGTRSVLSVTGDLDALSLLDYASRLFA